MRQDFNYHTHTFRCGHAKMDSDESYVLSAIKAGFKILGFSDHAPYPDLNKPRDRMDYDRLEDYLSSISSLKEKYRDQIDIKTGFEIEYFEEYDDYMDYLLSRVDYLILGQHYPTRFGEIDYCFTDLVPTWDQFEQYAVQVEKGLDTGKFMYLAHPDYYLGSCSHFGEHERSIAQRVIDAAERNHTPMELNIKLTRRNKRIIDDQYVYPYPYREFWKMVEGRDIRVLYGFDAHDSAVLQEMENFDLCDEILQGIKLDFIKEPLI